MQEIQKIKLYYEASSHQNMREGRSYSFSGDCCTHDPNRKIVIVIFLHKYKNVNF